MNVRSVLLSATVLGSAVLASLSACSSPDPGAVPFSERPTSGLSGDTPASSGTPGAGTDSGSTTAPPAEGGAGPTDPVFKGTAFAYEDPGQAADTKDPLGTHTGKVPLEGQDCAQSGCHAAGGAKPWAASGTVYAAQTGGATVAQAEIRIVGADGTDYGNPIYTDANGNFWLSQNTPLPAGARVGVRKGATTKLMGGTISGTISACNSPGCHGVDSNRIYAP